MSFAPTLPVWLAISLSSLSVAVLAADWSPAQPEARRSWSFAGVDFSNDFPSGRLADCAPMGDGEFLAVITPENTPINPSPWYAFQVRADRRQFLHICLTNTYAPQRGLPWLSRDGVKWTLLRPENYFTTGRTSRTAILRLEVGPRPLWVAAQEIIGERELNAWMDNKCRQPFVTESIIGQSVEGRPLRQLVISETTKPNYVFVTGRQHPPEITGTLGMFAFVDTLAANSRLAREFRREFQTVVLPLLNPDGVERGHWRHNLGGVDLNRDWGPFTQPESRAAANAVRSFLTQPGARPFVFLDFHSTHTNIFYAQPDDAISFPERFTERWLAGLQREYPRFWFDRDNAHNPGRPTARAWAYENLGSAAITWEFGYRTDRKLVRRAGVVGGEEFMRLLLAEAAKTTTVAKQ